MFKIFFVIAIIVMTSGCSLVGDVMEMRWDTKPYIEKSQFNEFKTISYSEVMREKDGYGFILNSYICRQDSKKNTASLDIYIENIVGETKTNFFEVIITGSNVIPSNKKFMKINSLLTMMDFSWVFNKKLAKSNSENWFSSETLRYQFPDLGGRTYETLERDVKFLKEFHEMCFILIEHNKYLKEEIENKKTKIRKA